MLSSIPGSSSSIPDPLSEAERAVISSVVDTFPPLTEGTQANLAALLRGTGRRDFVAEKFSAILRGGAR